MTREPSSAADSDELDPEATASGSADEELAEDELAEDERDDALVAAPARSGTGATSSTSTAASSKRGATTSEGAGRGSAKTVTPAGSKKHRSSEESAVAAAARAARQRQRVPLDPDANPPWFKPLMFGFLILGFLWIIVYYLSQGRLPIQELGAWNIAIGFGIAFIGFLMTTNWK